MRFLIGGSRWGRRSIVSWYYVLFRRDISKGCFCDVLSINGHGIATLILTKYAE